MFSGYSLDQWIGLAEYFSIITVILAGTFITSIKLANYSIKKELKRNKIKQQSKHKSKKSVFIDVA
jgi:hypothetical protein